MIRIHPRPLAPGSTLAVVATSGPVTDLPRWEEARAFLEGLGYRLRVMPSVGAAPHGFLAGPDEARLADLHAAFADPKVDGLLCAKGGYGCLRLLPGLDMDLVRRHPKALVGFSDVTTLLLAIHGATGLATFHGPMALFNLARHPHRDPVAADMVGMLAGTLPLPHRVTGTEAWRGGRAEGWLAGGNLATLVHLAGTPWFPDLTGALLFLEDVDEEPYRVDRYLTQLRLTGALDRVAGVVVGDFTRCEPIPADKPTFTTLEVLKAGLAGLGKPVLAGVALGHDLGQPTLPIGARARLDAEAGHLEVLEHGVR